MSCLPANRFRLAVMALFCVSATAYSQENEISTELHWGPPPRAALATILKDGKLTVKFAGAPCAVPDPNTGVYTIKTTLISQKLDADHYKAYDVRGNQINATRLRKELQSETLVLVAPSDKRVDPLQLRLYKGDVIVLVLTPPKAPPGVAPPPVAPPGAGYQQR
jgi:hypothetical protein